MPTLTVSPDAAEADPDGDEDGVVDAPPDPLPFPPQPAKIKLAAVATAKPFHQLPFFILPLPNPVVWFSLYIRTIGSLHNPTVRNPLYGYAVYSVNITYIKISFKLNLSQNTCFYVMFIYI